MSNKKPKPTTSDAGAYTKAALFQPGAARDRLVGNVVGYLSSGVSKPALERALEYWRNVDEALGERIAKGVTAR